MRYLRSALLGILLSWATVSVMGCRNPAKTSITPDKPARDTAEAFEDDILDRAQSITRIPFIGDDIVTASTYTLNNLSLLFKLGIGMCGIGVLIAVFGKVQFGVMMFVGGMCGIASAVLFSEYPRTVLLMPIVGLPFLIFVGVKTIKIKFRKAEAELESEEERLQREALEQDAKDVTDDCNAELINVNTTEITHHEIIDRR